MSQARMLGFFICSPAAQKKLGREWLGDYWRSFYARRKGEADNLRYILEHRYHSKK